MNEKYCEMIQKIKESDFLGEQGDFSRVCNSCLNIKKYEGADIAMETPVFLSIVIPTYKRPDLLKETIKSIILQEGFEDYEIVVVDNGVGGGKKICISTRIK